MKDRDFLSLTTKSVYTSTPQMYNCISVFEFSQVTSSNRRYRDRLLIIQFLKSLNLSAIFAFLCIPYDELQLFFDVFCSLRKSYLLSAFQVSETDL